MAVIEVQTYVDGANQDVGKSEIERAFLDGWRRHYESEYGPLVLEPPKDLKKTTSGYAALDRASDVRNPDLFYWVKDHGPLLGVEITTHSPDGSNIEKRYPFLWAARREGLTAFVATPYLKVRPGGSVNRLPHRHSRHNELLAMAWNPSDPGSSVQQLLPLKDLMGGDLGLVQTPIRKLLWSWSKLGNFLAHKTAYVVSQGSNKSALGSMAQFRLELIELARECKAATNHADASTLHHDGTRWIQVFNARPETGWWERGEGQFDSIDGRIMFTLSELDLLPASKRPKTLELWLPQMTSRHPWIQEQIATGYGSKRFRNLGQLLPAAKTNVKFRMLYSNQLTVRDWEILQANPSMCLERLVSGTATILRIGDFVPKSRAADVGDRAQHGLGDVAPIRSLVAKGDVFVATARAYSTGWQNQLGHLLSASGIHGEVYVPRVPQALLASVAKPRGVTLLGGESCGRPLLLLIRYLNRYGHMPA